jgi:hypothetical protein
MRAHALNPDTPAVVEAIPPARYEIRIHHTGTAAACSVGTPLPDAREGCPPTEQPG